MRFLHTADWQLGKLYARVTDPDKRSQLTDTAAHRHSRKLYVLHAQGLQAESSLHTTLSICFPHALRHYPLDRPEEPLPRLEWVRSPPRKESKPRL